MTPPRDRRPKKITVGANVAFQLGGSRVRGVVIEDRGSGSTSRSRGFEPTCSCGREQFPRTMLTLSEYRCTVRPMLETAKIQSVTIRNFRSIREVALRCTNMTALIGANNGGKSNILRAIRWALDPTVELTKSDFAPPIGESLAAPSVEVEFAIDDPLTGRPVQTSVSSILRIRRTIHEGRARYEREQLVPVDLSLRASAIPTKREELTRVPYAKDFGGQGKLTTAENRAKLNQLREAHIEAHRSQIEFSREFESVDPTELPLPEIVFLPAVRDLADTTGAKARSLFRQHVATRIVDHLKDVTEIREANEKLESAFSALADEKSPHRKEAVSALEDELRRAMRDWRTSFDIDFDPPTAPSISQYLQPTIRFMVDDGTTTPPEDKGHGFQRALLLELIQLESHLSGAKGGRANRSRLLLIEEPELYLHPQKQRGLAHKLRALGDRQDHQIVLATHSDVFIDLTYPSSIARVDKTASETNIHQPQDMFATETEDSKRQKLQFNMAYWFSQGRAQMLFARKTVFVEGQTEVAVFSEIAHRLQIYDPEVALIDCGSKDNLPIYCRVARALKLSFLIVHDEDLVSSTESGERPACPDCAQRRDQKHAKKHHAATLNQQILDAADGAEVIVMRPSTDVELGVSKRQGEKIGKPMAAIRYLDRLCNDQIPPRLIETARKIFA